MQKTINVPKYLEENRGIKSVLSLLYFSSKTEFILKNDKLYFVQIANFSVKDMLEIYRRHTVD